MSCLRIEYCGNNVWMAEAKVNGRWVVKSYDERPNYRTAKADFLKEAEEGVRV